jgi:hypothetical protein
MSKEILIEALALIALSPLIFLYGWPGALVLMAIVGLLMIRNVQKEQQAPRPTGPDSDAPAAAPPPEPEPDTTA